MNKPSKSMNEPTMNNTDKPITRDKQRGFAVVERIFTLATLATTILIAVGGPEATKNQSD